MGNLPTQTQQMLQFKSKTNHQNLNMFSQKKNVQSNSQTITIYRQQLIKQKEMFQFRLTHKNVLVYCFGFEIQQSKHQDYFQHFVCTKSHIDPLNITFHSEKINMKFKDLYNIPVKQGLQILQNSIKGFSILYDYFGYFQPLLNMIMKQGNEWKVWINQNILTIQPNTLEINQHRGQFHKFEKQKNIFLKQVVHLFDILRDENCPQFSYSEFIFGKLISVEVITQNQILCKIASKSHEPIQFFSKKRSLRKLSVQSDNTVKRLHKKSLHQSQKSQNLKLQDFRKTKKSISQIVGPHHQKINFKNTNKNCKVLFQDSLRSQLNKNCEYFQIKNKQQIFSTKNMNNKYRKIEPFQVEIIEKMDCNNKSTVFAPTYTEWTKKILYNKQNIAHKHIKQGKTNLNQTQQIFRKRRNKVNEHGFNDQIRNPKRSLFVNDQNLSKIFTTNLSIKLPVNGLSNQFQNNLQNQINEKRIKNSNVHSSIKSLLNVAIDVASQKFYKSSSKISQYISTQKQNTNQVNQRKFSKYLKLNAQLSDKIINDDQTVSNNKNYYQHAKNYDEKFSDNQNIIFPNLSTAYNSQNCAIDNCSVNNYIAIDNVNEKKKLQYINDYLNFQIKLNQRNLSKNNGIAGKPIKLCCSQQLDIDSQSYMTQDEKQNQSQISKKTHNNQIKDPNNIRSSANQLSILSQKNKFHIEKSKDLRNFKQNLDQTDIQSKLKQSGYKSGLTSLLQNDQQVLHTIKQIEIDSTIDQDIVKDLNKMFKRQIFSQQPKVLVPHFIQQS